MPKKSFFIFLVFVLITSFTVNAGILELTKLKYLKGDTFYSELDNEFIYEDQYTNFQEIRNTCDLAVSYLFSGSFDTTYAMLKDASEKTSVMNDSYLKALGYAKTAYSYAEFKNILGVRELALAEAVKGIETVATGDMQIHEKVRLNNEFIKILLNTRYYKQANNLLAENRELIKESDNAYYNVLCALDITRFINILKDDVQGSNENLDICKTNLQQTDDAYLTGIFNIKVADYMKIKKAEYDSFINNAIANADLLEDSYLSNDILIKTCEFFMVNGNAEKALSLIDTLKDVNDPYFSALSTLEEAGFYYISGLTEKSLNLVKVVENSLSNIEDELKIDVLNKIFWLYVVNEDTENALRINKLAENHIYNENSLNIVANNYAKLKAFDLSDNLLK